MVSDSRVALHIREGSRILLNQKEWDRMIGQELYDPFNVHDDSFQRVHAAQRKFNASDDLNDRQAFEELKRCFAQAPDDMVLLAPVYFDHGDRIRFGRHFFANTGLTILDENYVTFGDNVFLAPHVSIYTAGHPIDAEVRNTNLEYAKPVTIGSDVWIGGNVVINPGVTIGDDVVIGSGSVVTHDIPSHVVAAGNPCRVIRPITKADADLWHRKLSEYKKSILPHIIPQKQPRRNNMSEKQIIAKKINDWLNACVDESGAFFLNTIEAGRPKSRPISFHMLKDGVNYFGVGAMKEVYRQMQENPYVEICGLMGKGKLFFRYYGKAVFEQGDELAQEALAQPGYPVMKKIYTPESGNRFAVFHLEDATAEKRAMMSVLETWNL